MTKYIGVGDRRYVPQKGSCCHNFRQYLDLNISVSLQAMLDVRKNEFNNNAAFRCH